MLNFYAVLGVDERADPATIKKAFHQLALENHPDKTGINDSTRFRQVAEAYECLSDPARKLDHDHQLLQSRRQEFGAGFSSSSGADSSTAFEQHASERARQWREFAAGHPGAPWERQNTEAPPPTGGFRSSFQSSQQQPYDQMVLVQTIKTKRDLLGAAVQGYAASILQSSELRSAMMPLLHYRQTRLGWWFGLYSKALANCLRVMPASLRSEWNAQNAVEQERLRSTNEALQQGEKEQSSARHAAAVATFDGAIDEHSVPEALVDQVTDLQTRRSIHWARQNDMQVVQQMRGAYVNELSFTLAVDTANSDLRLRERDLVALRGRVVTAMPPTHAAYQAAREAQGHLEGVWGALGRAFDERQASAVNGALHALQTQERVEEELFGAVLAGLDGGEWEGASGLDAQPEEQEGVRGLCNPKYGFGTWFVMIEVAVSPTLAN